jgi:CheY-like chemotaxis protein
MPNDPKISASRTILVVDDDEAFLRSLRLLLEVDGFTVVTAENGVRGLQAFRNRNPDIVLVDIMMPKLGGMETIRQMRRERPGAKVIAMSGGAGPGGLDLATAAREVGAVAALEKPFDPAALASLLRDLLPQSAG